LSIDPIRSGEGSTPYAYVRDNPANSIDPLGTFDYAYHKSFTETALRGIFSEQAISKILGISGTLSTSGNWGQDNPSNNSFRSEPSQHFDNNMIGAGTQYISDEYSLISNIGSNKSSPEEEILWAYGRLLHATQDFWSHSNYVELWLSSMAASPSHEGFVRFDPVPEFVYMPIPTVVTPYDIPSVAIPPMPTSPFKGWNLHTGFYKAPPESLTVGDETHDELNKDNPGASATLILGIFPLNASKRGGTRVAKSSYLYFDYAYAGALKSTMASAGLFEASIAMNTQFRHIDWKTWKYPGAQR
jgi:hypothetical protein